jgi:hypothetical protein
MQRMSDREYYWRCAKVLVGWRPTGWPLTIAGTMVLAVAMVAIGWTFFFAFVH